MRMKRKRRRKKRRTRRMKKHMMKTNQKWQARWRYITRPAEMFAICQNWHCTASGRLMLLASDQRGVCVLHLATQRTCKKHDIVLLLIQGDEEADWEMDLLNDEDENERWVSKAYNSQQVQHCLTHVAAWCRSWHALVLTLRVILHCWNCMMFSLACFAGCSG